jgi:hypothetical protein
MSHTIDEEEYHAKLAQQAAEARIATPPMFDREGNEVSKDSIYDTRLIDDRTMTPMWTRMSNVIPRPIEWLWPGRFPLGMLSMLAGEQGIGKSFFAIDMATRVSTGADWPDGSGSAPQGDTIMLLAEDHLECTVHGRLTAARALHKNIVVHYAVRLEDPSNPCHSKIVAFDLSQHLLSLHLLIKGSKTCRLVILDPITSYLGDTDQNSNADVRAALDGLVVLAAKHNCAIVGLTHLNKNEEARTLNRMLGSTAFSAIARSIFTIRRGKHDPDDLQLEHTKCNVGPKLPLAYLRLENDVVVWQDAAAKSDVTTTPISDKIRSAVLARLRHGPCSRPQLLKLLGEKNFAARTIELVLRSMVAQQSISSTLRGSGRGAKAWLQLTKAAFLRK